MPALTAEDFSPSQSLLSSPIYTTEKIIFYVEVRALQRFNEKLETTQVSINRRMDITEYNAAVKMSVQQLHSFILRNL